MAKLPRPIGDSIWEKTKVPNLIKEVYRKHFSNRNICECKVIDMKTFAFFISSAHLKVFKDYKFIYPLKEYLNDS